MKNYRTIQSNNPLFHGVVRRLLSRKSRGIVSVAHVTTSSRKNSRNMRSICLFVRFPSFLRLYVYCRIFVSFRASLEGFMRVGEAKVEVEVEVEDFASRLLDLEGV